MQKFWSYVTRGKYSIGCTGQSVYVYENGCEILKLTGLLYTYKSCISPSLEYFALKSNTGIMYIYSLKSLTLLKRLRFAKEEATQDEWFTFSLNGEEIISVDSYDSCHNCITHYSVPTLEIKRRYFNDNDKIEPRVIELIDNDIMYALFWERNETHSVGKYFIAILQNGEIIQKIYISEKDCELYSGFKDLQSGGFTEKAKEWSSLSWYEGVENIEALVHSLEALYEKYNEKE